MRTNSFGSPATGCRWVPRFLWAIPAMLLAHHCFADSAARPDLTDCPYEAQMHGMLPLLFKIGLLPRPPMATSIAPSDASTSIVINPDSAQQIRCGRTPVDVISDIVFAHPTLRNGKAKELRM